ncbi:DUF29 domain-containing protein [Geminocystis sp.]|uniref:DUF29 domain-containing protein n=1 Tax=Geminocystis sp. TaxID=2664100 RepID=UPI003593E165
MTAKTKINLQDLYEIDDYLWIQETVKLLKEKQFNELDLENLIEELEDLGNEKKHRVRSLLEQIIRHLLLLEYWDSEYERNANHWEAEVIGFRNQLNDRMTSNFYKYLETDLHSIYQNALRYAKRKSKLNNLPSECPYNIDQLLDEDWFPKQ